MIYVDGFCGNLERWIEGETCVYLRVRGKLGDSAAGQGQKTIESNV